MRKHTFKQLIVPLLLILASLACEVDTLYVFTHPTEAAQTLAALPTIGQFSLPSQAGPTSEAPAPTQAGPIVMTLVGSRISPPPAGFQDAKECSAATELTLTIQPDGTAELYSTGPNFNEHYNCTTSDTIEAWYVYGSANFTSGLITWKTCNNENFEAVGEMSFDAAEFYGTVACIYKPTMEKQITISR